MRKTIPMLAAVATALAIAPILFSQHAVAAESSSVVSKSPGLAHPESVAYDPQRKVLYISDFVSARKPLQKDGKGRISKVSLDGRILEANFLPAKGGALNKPKGIWVEGNRLWVTDIDVVWEFDLVTRRGRKVALPGAKSANDPTVVNNALFVSDMLANKIFRVQPADFLDIEGRPQVTDFISGLDFGPNGLYPGPNGTLLIAGISFSGDLKGLYQASREGKLKTLKEGIGRLDGLARLQDGTILITDWKSHSLLSWDGKNLKTIASGISGPADFCVIPEGDGYLVVVPNLEEGTLHFISVAK